MKNRFSLLLREKEQRKPTQPFLNPSNTFYMVGQSNNYVELRSRANLTWTPALLARELSLCRGLQFSLLTLLSTDLCSSFSPAAFSSRVYCRKKKLTQIINYSAWFTFDCRACTWYHFIDIQQINWCTIFCYPERKSKLWIQLSFKLSFVAILNSEI